MSETRVSIAQHYHERTKYDPETIAAKSQGLDWDSQPLLYKEYKIGTEYDLKPYLSEQVQSGSDGLLVNRWQRLSRLLYYSYGLTAKVTTMVGEPLYLRAAPSAGGLYPAEIYVISGGTPLLPAGLYNYQPQKHALVQFWEDSNVWGSLQAACFQHPALEYTRLAIATTAVFFRSAWRYQDRAYRRIYLDTGHLLGNIELASAINGYRPYAIGGFRDEALERLLYLDTESEGVTTAIALLDLQDEAFTGIGREARSTAELQSIEPQVSHPFPMSSWTALSSPIQTDYPYVPDGQLLDYFHKATNIEALADKQEGARNVGEVADLQDDKYNFPFCAKVATHTEPISWGNELEELENTMLRRRSTRAYTGSALDLSELKALLDFTYQPQHYTEQGLDGAPDYFDLGLIETFVAVSAVTGLEEGCYYYAPKAQELRQIRFKNFRRELHYLCLGQNLGRDAAAVLFHTADLQQAVEKYGDRVYRYLHMDAGHLGQRLNLAAIMLGLGASGIGGFFDDRVNEVLGIPSDEAVLYISTLGQPA